MPVASKIFAGYRALGFVSNHVPLSVLYHPKHKENYVVTCVGKSFHTYNCSKLGIVSVSDSHPDNISCTAVDAKYVYTGCGNVIRAFTRGKKEVHAYHGHEEDVQLLLPFGQHLISVDVHSKVKVWDIESEGIYLEMDFSGSSFTITALMHPSTYLNKVLLGSKQGRMQLWNIRLDKMLYTFTGWESAIVCVEQAPAVDVVAVGLEDGRVILHNLKYDESILKFQQDWGPVTCISFRTDGHPIMATGSTVGHIALWDLEEKKIMSQLRNAHMSSVSGMKCLASQPLMVTSAADNSLKVWIFDQSDGGGRLLNQRAGHSAPPDKARHYGNNGNNILTAGQDSTLRSFSTQHDKHNKSLGRASFNKSETKKSGLKRDQHMMPSITQFTADPSRESDWDNVVACHRGLCEVTTWSYQRSTMGKHRLKHDRFTQKGQDHRFTVANTVDISPCGNFTVIGYSSGYVDKFNLQSGLHRGSYGDPSAHICSVRGVAIDGLNHSLVTAGASGELKFWRFKKCDLIDAVTLKSQIMSMVLHRDSSMLAVAHDDFDISIVDIDTRRVVRKYTGHSGSITDMSFSPDSRWLISSSMDCSVRTWDMPTGRLIDCFAVDAAVTSVSMSPTGDFLCTTHVDDVGVYLWSNCTLFAHVPLIPLPSDYEPHTIEMPSTQRKSGESADINEEDDEEEEVLTDFKSPEQLSDELVTLSLLPNSRWQNLLNLDTIRRRNKPKEPPKVPKSAPFFLPTVAGLDFKFAEQNSDESSKKSESKIISGSLLPMSDLAKMLSEDEPQYDVIMEKMKSLGPSAIDVEIRSLSPEGGGSILIMCGFLNLISHAFSTNKNFELANAYLGLFVQIHGTFIAGEKDILSKLEQIGTQQTESWKRIQELLMTNMCLATYIRSATL